MNPKIKILELLEKVQLSDNEQKELDTLVGNDPDLGEFVTNYYKLSKVIISSSHLNEDEISDYVLFKNGVTPDNNLIVKRIPFIEAHLRKCEKCSELFKDFNSEFSEVDNFLAEKISKGKENSIVSSIQNSGVDKQSYKAPRYAFASIIAIGLVYLSLYIISSFTTPQFYKDAAINSESEFSVNRGRATEDFQNSLRALDNNNFEEAISYLQKDIKNNPDDETIFYSYYILGLSYLETAEHTVIGLFPGYNISKTEKGVEYLKESVRKNESGKFINIKLNSYFYLAKASLMLNDKISAENYLKLVISGRGSKMEEAQKLLGELE
jgi:tetratricopeptide (TPR) repeat protein